ncbi:uncharacterized protein si:ch211-102c2.4 [Kryptolebias marmoratus]|uniref:uncharacterized protein si:ch211-102c2.4 n=1 Tax=Kryptolebias marmoratus TaxID=37003 RepID=UPI0018ACC39B|nr:uncharacterized protein si:ch211-102c2.4 [Kryptolebias marmoratus]
MHFLILILLLGIGESEAVLWQKLSCPFEPEHKDLLRVWCRQSSAGCCTGLTFSQSAQLVDGGRLRVTHDTQSFSVEVVNPDRKGVYWCGVLSSNNTIIRLAEGIFYDSLGAYIWSFARWILLPFLPTVTVFVYKCSARL